MKKTLFLVRGIGALAFFSACNNTMVSNNMAANEGTSASNIDAEYVEAKLKITKRPYEFLEFINEQADGSEKSSLKKSIRDIQKGVFKDDKPDTDTFAQRLVYDIHHNFLYKGKEIDFSSINSCFNNWMKQESQKSLLKIIKIALANKLPSLVVWQFDLVHVPNLEYFKKLINNFPDPASRQKALYVWCMAYLCNLSLDPMYNFVPSTRMLCEIANTLQKEPESKENEAKLIINFGGGASLYELPFTFMPKDKKNGSQIFLSNIECKNFPFGFITQVEILLGLESHKTYGLLVDPFKTIPCKEVYNNCVTHVKNSLVDKKINCELSLCLMRNFLPVYWITTNPNREKAFISIISESYKLLAKDGGLFIVNDYQGQADLFKDKNNSKQEFCGVIYRVYSENAFVDHKTYQSALNALTNENDTNNIATIIKPLFVGNTLTSEASHELEVPLVFDRRFPGVPNDEIRKLIKESETPDSYEMYIWKSKTPEKF